MYGSGLVTIGLASACLSDYPIVGLMRLIFDHKQKEVRIQTSQLRSLWLVYFFSRGECLHTT
jgi:hypothetical protein